MKRHLALALLCALGCSRAVTPPLEIASQTELPKVRTIAVVPVVASSATRGDAAARAPEAVSGLLFDGVARQTVWVRVDSSKVHAAIASTAAGDVESRAGAVAAKVGADAAITATVAVYAERVGSDYGASDGASVSLKVMLVPAGAKQAAWKAEYAIHQVPLTYNLWNFWSYERGGLRWLPVDDLARIGVDEAVDRLAKVVGSP